MLVFLFLLALLSPPSLTATWQGDDRLNIEWAGPGCLYYQRAGRTVAWLTCEPGVVVLRPGGDAAVRPEPGARLFVAGNLADGALVEARVPWRLTFPVVLGAP